MGDDAGDEFGHGITWELITGFTDFRYRYPKVEIYWQVIGLIFWLVNFGSFLPQTVELVTSRSSYGLEPIATFFQSLGHFLLVINLFCFKSFDFVGFFQYHDPTAFPRVLTFCNMFFQWILLLPTVYQLMIYHDREIRQSRGSDLIRRDWIKAVGQAILLTLTDLSLLIVWIILGITYGFEQEASTSLGEICGTLSTILEFVFFVPQMYTTCKLKDSGSLSLLMLEIQAPADLANTLYMWLGTKDHWTTWLTILVDAIEEFTLLGTCLIFNCLKAKRNKELEKQRIFTMSLNASLEPEPLLFEQF